MQPNYQQGSARAWWWMVARHLDETNLALVNAMAHNVDDPALPLALGEAVRQAQAILFEIFHAKGLLPPMNGSSRIAPPMSGPAASASGNGSLGAWVPGPPASPPQFSLGQQVPPPPGPPASPPQFSSGHAPPPPWMPDFSQLSSAAPPPVQPQTEVVEQAAADAGDQPPEEPSIVPEPVNSEAEAPLD